MDLEKQIVEKPLFSVIVILYNSEVYIDKCVQSILNQTMENFELLLVDDGSVDGTAMKCCNYEQTDSRVRAISKSNGGISDARNTGILNARGEYAVFVDGDDWLEKNYLESIEKLLKKNKDIDCVLGRMMEHNVESGEEKVMGEKFGSEINELLQKCSNGKDASVALLNKYGKFPMGMGVRGAYRVEMIRRENIMFWGKYYEDIEYTMNIMSHARGVLCNTESFYYFRNHPTSTSKKVQIKYAKDIVDMLKEWEDKIKQEDNSCFKEALERETGRRYANTIVKYAKKLSDSEVAELIKLASESKHLLRYGKSRMSRALRMSFSVLGVKNTIMLYRKIL